MSALPPIRSIPYISNLRPHDWPTHGTRRNTSIVSTALTKMMRTGIIALKQTPFGDRMTSSTTDSILKPLYWTSLSKRKLAGVRRRGFDGVTLHRSFTLVVTMFSLVQLRSFHKQSFRQPTKHARTTTPNTRPRPDPLSGHDLRLPCT